MGSRLQSGDHRPQTLTRLTHPIRVDPEERRPNLRALPGDIDCQAHESPLSGNLPQLLSDDTAQGIFQSGR